MTIFRRVLFASISFCLAIFCLAVSAEAQTPDDRQTMIQEGKTDGGVVEGIVAEVQGTMLKLEGGLIIDTSRGLIRTVGFQRQVTVQPGMSVRVTIDHFEDSGAVAVASYVRVQVPNEIVLSGSVQEADHDNGVITVLNRRVSITAETVFPVGFNTRKLRPGFFLSVIARLNGSGDPVALFVFPRLGIPTLFP